MVQKRKINNGLFLFFLIFGASLGVCSAQTMRIMTIDEMYHLAEQNSNELKLASGGVDLNSEAVNVVKNSRLPSIDVSASALYLSDAVMMDRDFTNVSVEPSPHFGNNFAVEASQVLFAGGAITANIAKAELQKQIATLAFSRKQSDIRFLLIGYSLDLYKLSNREKVYERNADKTKVLIKEVKDKQKAGMALNNDITRYELTLRNIELSLLQTRNSYQMINNQLLVILGLPDSVVIAPDTVFTKQIESLPSEKDLLSEAEQNRQELKSAQTNVQIAGENLKIAKADYYPSLALVAGNSFNGPITFELPPIDKNLNIWYAGVGLKYNLSSLYTTKKNVALARQQQKLAETSQLLTRDQTKVEVKNAYIKYTQSIDQMYSCEKSVELATENYRIINNRYLNNLALITEMLDAQVAQLNAELQLEDAKAEIIFNYYQMKHTTGGL